VKVGDFQKKINSTIFGHEATPVKVMALRDAAPTPPTSRFSTTGSVVWLTMDKTLGPLHIQKIGVGWRNSKLSLLLDAGMTASGLTIDLINFALNAPPMNLSDFDFSLDGLGIAFEGGPVSISGAFAKVGTGYTGEAHIKIGPINLFAVGAYDTIDGHPSMFIFAMSNEPLGGPPAFFVTGIAAGFGYNRAL
jgi:hypothetical protein